MQIRHSGCHGFSHATCHNDADDDNSDDGDDDDDEDDNGDYYVADIYNLRGSYKNINGVTMSLCIRQPEDRLWKYIEKFELRNLLDNTIVKPKKGTEHNFL